MEELKYCRVCLVTDVKMYSLDITSSDSIGLIYSHIAQIRISDSNQHVCFECATVLQKYQGFRSKCLRSHNLLSRIVLNSTEITKQVIANIDRKENKLQSNLILSQIVLTCCDKLHRVNNEECQNNSDHAKDNEQVKIFEFEIKSEITDVTYNGDTKNDTENKLNTSNDDFIESSKENTPAVKSKRKSLIPKEHKTKKRKIETAISSDDNLSDNEPLSKCAIKNTDKKIKASKKIDELKKNSWNIEFFDDYATVTCLTPDDARKELLIRKDSSNYKNNPYKCNFCYKGYEVKMAFENHMKKHSLEYGDYECDVCHLRFPKNLYLCKHRLNCHKRKFSCKLCPYVCYCMNQARSHVNRHKGKKYPCKDCGEIFSMPNSLLMHKHVKHLEDSGHEGVCEFCGNTFGTPRGLYFHKMKLHRMDKNNKEGPNCEECGVHFANEVAWKRHLLFSSKHSVRDGCKYCGEVFPTAAELRSHQLANHGVIKRKRYANKIPGSCTICKKWLTSNADYKNHISSDHPHLVEAKKTNKPFVCEVCGLTFKLQCHLRYHQRSHTGERPYACAQCGKTFPSGGSLAIHRELHDARTHACPLCARLFTFKNALTKHIKMHQGIRPHKCTLCDKGFLYSCDLKVHIRYVHNKVPWPKKKSKRIIADDSAPS